MPVHRTDDLSSADHRADGHSDTDTDSISAIQRLYKVSTGRLTSPSVFSESSQAPSKSSEVCRGVQNLTQYHRAPG